MIGKASLSGCCVAFGKLLAISTNNDLTLFEFFADVSMCKIPFSSAYAFASLKSTLRRASRSALLPAYMISIIIIHEHNKYIGRLIKSEI